MAYTFALVNEALVRVTREYSLVDTKIALASAPSCG
jgi:hypothetical protein